jgi:hypothetical protein
MWGQLRPVGWLEPTRRLTCFLRGVDRLEGAPASSPRRRAEAAPARLDAPAPETGIHAGGADG